ncbi:MAG: ribonuclease HII, partial [Clostridia bacterium]|nr:ribonuclease HII [Clostridia bacterium]
MRHSERNEVKSKSLKTSKNTKGNIMARTKHDTFTMLEYEHKYLDLDKKYIAGVDEVGRGPLAGPVVVACVIMPLGDEDIIQGVNDSKKVSEKNREILFDKIMQKALACKVEWADEKVIDEINILAATK